MLEKRNLSDELIYRLKKDNQKLAAENRFLKIQLKLTTAALHNQVMHPVQLQLFDKENPR